MKVLGPVMYELNFPNSIKIIKIRHILVLELADPKAPLMEDMPNINLKS